MNPSGAEYALQTRQRVRSVPQENETSPGVGRMRVSIPGLSADNPLFPQDGPHTFQTSMGFDLAWPAGSAIPEPGIASQANTKPSTIEDRMATTFVEA